ncbi:hypothetical protein AB0N14_13755 [Streptomyces sp. NPDC051104]
MINAHLNLGLTWLCLIALGGLVAAAGGFTGWCNRRAEKRRRP